MAALDLPPTIWIPEKPAIIRPAEQSLIRPGFLPASRVERRAALADLIRSGRISKNDAGNALVLKMPVAQALFVLTHLVGFWAGSEPLLASYVNAVTSSADATTYDFGNFLAPRNGLMIVGAHGVSGGAATISSVSIGGTNGSIAGQFGGAAWTPFGFASRVVAAGNNNVSVTFSTGMVRAAIAVWLLTGYASSVPNSIDGLDGGSGSTSISVTIDIPENGVALFIHSHANTNAIGWSSADERADTGMETYQFGAADKLVTAAIAGHTETASWTGTAGRGICGASWK